MQAVDHIEVLEPHIPNLGFLADHLCFGRVVVDPHIGLFGGGNQVDALLHGSHDECLGDSLGRGPEARIAVLCPLADHAVEGQGSLQPEGIVEVPQGLGVLCTLHQHIHDQVLEGSHVVEDQHTNVVVGGDLLVEGCIVTDGGIDRALHGKALLARGVCGWKVYTIARS